MARLRFLLAVAASIALLGCNAEPKRVDEGGRVLLESSMTKHNIKIQRQDSDRIEGGLLRVRTLIDNKEKENVWVDIQVVWKDKDAFELYKTNWAPKFLPAGLVQDHDIVAMRSGAADYEFRIRRPVKAKD